MTEKLLTTRELVDLLQLDRVTIYKMVKDGDLPAWRVGGQWRFSADAIDAWLKTQRGEPLEPRRGELPPEPQPTEPAPEPSRRDIAVELAGLRLTDLIPIATLQSIQDQFAHLLGVASFITDLDGQPLAPCSRCSRFCQIVHTRAEGMVACQASWRAIAGLDEAGAAAVHTCHAGIQYASAPVQINGQRIGMVTAGQFLTESPDPEAFRAQALATGARLGVDGEGLAQAQDSIEIVSVERALQITNLLATIANAVSSIAYQSYQARQTLAQIAQLTAAVQAAQK